MLFNERLKEIRIKKNLTQDDFAKLLNISPSSISLYESGNREPSLNTLIKIAIVLDVSTDYLLGLTDIEKPAGISISSEEKQKIIDEVLKILNKNK